jgi:hypothetical protein
MTFFVCNVNQKPVQCTMYISVKFVHIPVLQRIGASIRPGSLKEC